MSRGCCGWSIVVVPFVAQHSWMFGCSVGSSALVWFTSALVGVVGGRLDRCGWSVGRLFVGALGWI